MQKKGEKFAKFEWKPCFSTLLDPEGKIHQIFEKTQQKCDELIEKPDLSPYAPHSFNEGFKSGINKRKGYLPLTWISLLLSSPAPFSQINGH